MPMLNCTADVMAFGQLKRRKIEANFQDGAMSSDGGLVLLRQIDRRLGLSKAIAEGLHTIHAIQIGLFIRCEIWLHNAGTVYVAAMKT
jgi:hypothetical protein